MVNRKTSPAIHKIVKLNIPETVQYELKNGTKVCEINLGSQEILKIDIVHVAGRSVEDSKLAGRAVSSLLKDGCAGKNSAEIAEAIDYYGSSIKTASNMDFSYTSFYTLTKYADKAIAMLSEIYTHPTFAEDEIEKFKKLNIQKLKEELTKNEVLTYRYVTEEIFGKNHSYGYNSDEIDYINLNRFEISSHFADYYGSDNCFIFLSGKISDPVRKLISDYFGQETQAAKKKLYTPSQIPVEAKNIRTWNKSEHQSAIKTGRRMFDRNHPDNVAVFMLNTIFGGYFGSRLMASIREDMGLTYDISSCLDQMLYDGFFYVSTEAATEYTDRILEEIYHQMQILQQDKVPVKELNMVKNYLMGNFMNMLDGPLNVSSFVKSMVLVGKKPTDFSTFVDDVLQIDALKIVEMAQKYLNRDLMTEVVVSPW
jgi:predicted Zn-dependent peptidase